MPDIDNKRLRITLVGNCQTLGLSHRMQAMLGPSDVAWYPVVAPWLERLVQGALDARLESSDFIFAHTHHQVAALFEGQGRLRHLASRVRHIPTLVYAAFHPDMDYIHPVDPAQGMLQGVMSDYHSMLIYWAWQNGLSQPDAQALFCEEVYAHLGYFDYAAAGQEWLRSHAQLHSGIDLAPFLERWDRQGVWMHSLNHPKAGPLNDLAHCLLSREGLALHPQLANLVVDELTGGPVWPVYPEIARRLGLADGHMRFKLIERARHWPQQSTPPRGNWMQKRIAVPDKATRELLYWPVESVSLNEFIDASYRLYDTQPADSLRCERMQNSRFQSLREFLGLRAQRQAASPAVAQAGSHPYSELPPHRFWRLAITQTPMADIDPIVRAPDAWRLDPQTKIATAGSCFAQRIAQSLQQSGYHYFVAENADGLAPEAVERRQFGVYSARYGNLYTARQLRQLIERAYGRFTPVESAWQRADGRWVDPFRPQIEPDGFDGPEAVAAAREPHFAAVRRMFEELDVMVFTLGLTEAWRNRVDGAVYPLAPGVAGGALDAAQHEFVNFDVAEVLADLRAFAAQLRAVNARARLIVTVSPVSIIATYENSHVLVASTHTKSVLRVAAGDLVRAEPGFAEYFPGYELVVGPQARGHYFDENLRAVSPEGVTHVMRLFFKHYAVLDAHNPAHLAAQAPLPGGEPEVAAEVPTPQEAAPAPDGDTTFQEELRQQNERLSEVVCEEELLDVGGKS